MNFVDLSYYYNSVGDPESILKAHAPNLGYLQFLPEHWNCSVVKFLNHKAQLTRGRTNFYFFKGSVSRLWFPAAVNRFIAELKPDVVMLHGLIFPHQLLFLKRNLPRKTKIIVQHHAEQPAKGLRRKLQQRADKQVDGYLFATAALAMPWLHQGIINYEKVFEVMEGSSVMQRMDKQEARKQLNLADGPVFLWVGHLNENKDPLTLLAAFEQFLEKYPSANLYMIYQGADLLSEVQSRLDASKTLAPVVRLMGKMEREQLAQWYNAADYFISTSHSEGSGYALLEAMSCGCIPVVTNIPSFKKITDDGRLGFLFERGNSSSLLEALGRSQEISKHKLIPEILSYFENELSFKAIATQLSGVCNLLMSK